MQEPSNERRRELTTEVLRAFHGLKGKPRRILTDVSGLIFIRDDGRAIHKNMIIQAVRVARRRAKVNNFRFTIIDTAQKGEWSRRGVVDVVIESARAQERCNASAVCEFEARGRCKGIRNFAT